MKRNEERVGAEPLSFLVPPHSFLALGDSYTIGEAVAEDGRWPVQLARALRAEGVPLADPRIIATTGWTTDELSAAIDAAGPLGGYGLVSLLIGVNNQYRGRDAATYRAEFAALLERAIGFAGGRPERVLVLSIPDWGVTPFATRSGRDAARIAGELDAYNAAARQACAARGVAFVDITAVSRARGAEPAMLAEDGLHPSEAMYREWTRLALPAARRLLSDAGDGTASFTELAPFDRARARRIARAFLPRHPLGNRHDYYYALFKLRSDPLYPGVLAALRGSDAPLLDLGCGLGLLAHALRQDGQAMPYRGVDIDAAKIARAQRVAANTGLDEVRFEVADLGRGTPAHRGSVAILDVLQYLSLEAQRALLATIAAMLTPDARLVIRTGLGDASRRGRTTRVTDRLANLIGWMQERPKCYPTSEGLRAMLQDAGLRAAFAPLYGNTPFNNWLVVATPQR